MANLEKIYTIKIEATQAQQALDTAIKQFADYKAKAAAANQEVKESKQIYQENLASLKELVQQQKALEAAKSKAGAGAPAVVASAALDKNLAAQKLLNSIVQESKIDFQNAKTAAEAAGAAVGKQAGSVKELQAAMKGYGAAAAEAALDFAPGTVGALELEIDRLRAGLKDMVPGSKEAAAAIQAIGAKESQLRGLANAINAANPRAQARAFTVFTQAMTGVVGISTAAAQAFGLSDKTAQEYAQRMQSLVGVLASVESINKLLNGENVALIKSVVASGRAWLTAGESATVAGRATRTAVASTGIGLLVLAVGALISLFMDLGSTVKGSESTFTKYKAAVVGGFDTMISLVKDFLKYAYQITTLDFSGAMKTAGEAGANAAKAYTQGRAAVIDTARRKELADEAEKTARYISIIQSRGEDTLALEVANSKRLVEAQKQGSKERLDAVRDYIVLKNQYLKREAEEEKAQALARLENAEKIEAANGRAIIEQQRKVLQEKLQQQIDADLLMNRYESAAQSQLRAEIQALNDAYDVEQMHKRQAAELARLDAIISLRAAKGQEAYNQEVAHAEKELKFLRSAAQRDEAAIIDAESRRNNLVAARAYELTQRRQALKLAELDAIISLENTKGIDSYNEQVKREEQKLDYMKLAGTRNLAAERDQQSKIDNLRAARAVKIEADERAADLARLNARIAFLQVQGEETTQLQLNLKAKELTTLLAAATRNEAAIIAKQGEIDALSEQQQIQAEEKRRALRVEEFENEMTLLEKQGKDVLALRIKFAKEEVARDTDTSEKGLAKRRADLQALNELEAEMAERKPNIIGNGLLKLIGIKEEDFPKAKQAFGEFYQSINELGTAFLDAATQQTEQALASAQQQLQTATDQLNTLQSSIAETEGKLGQSQGAARDYYLQKLAKEREEVQKVAAAKAKAAAEEKKQQQEQHKLQKIGLEISAAETLAANVAAAANAVAAGVKAISSAAEAPFPATIPSIIAAIAAVVATVASARQLATAVKYQDGGLIHGASHANGGVAFTVAGRPGFEAEGGEFIFSRAAVAKHGVPFLQMLNDAGNTYVKPHPTGHFASGGMIPNLPAGMVAIPQQEFSVLLTNTGIMIEHLQSINGATNDTANHTNAIQSYGPPVLEFGYEAELKRQEMANGIKQAENWAKI